MQKNRALRQPVLQQFKVPSKGSQWYRYITKSEAILRCICLDLDEVGQVCFKCGLFVHKCLAEKENRYELYECASCVSKDMDPMFKVRKVLVESYFKIDKIFEL